MVNLTKYKKHTSNTRELFYSIAMFLFHFRRFYGDNSEELLFNGFNAFNGAA